MIQHEEGEIGGGGGGACVLHADALHRIVGGRQSGSVHEVQRHAANRRGFLNRIACSAGDGSDDRALAAQERVEQAGLAHIGSAQNGDMQPLAQQAPAVRASQQRSDLRAGALDHLGQLGAVGLGNLFFRKVDTRLDAHQRLQRRSLRGADARREIARELAHGEAQASLGFRLNQRHHRLGLGEVQPPIQERAQRHLARTRRPRPSRQCQRQDAPQQQRPAVGVQLHHVLTSIGMRSAHECSQHLVYRRAARRVHHMPVGQHMRGRRAVSGARRMAGPEERVADRERVGSAHPHDAHATRTRRGGDGGDRVGRVGVCGHWTRITDERPGAQAAPRGPRPRSPPARAGGRVRCPRKYGITRRGLRRCLRQERPRTHASLLTLVDSAAPA